MAGKGRKMVPKIMRVQSQGDFSPKENGDGGSVFEVGQPEEELIARP